MYAKYFNSKIVDKALKSKEKTDEDWDSYMFRIINLTNSNRQLNALKELPAIWKLIDLKNIKRLTTSEDALNVAIEVYKLVTKSIKSDANNTKTKENKTKENTSKELSDNEKKRLDKETQKQRDFVNGNSKKVGKLSKKDNAIIRSLKESGTENNPVTTGRLGANIFNVDCIVIKKMTYAVMAHMDSIFDSYNLKKGRENTSSWYGPGKGVSEGIILGKQLGKKLQLRNEERSLKSTRLNTGKIDRRLISQLGFQNANVFHRIVTDQYKNFFLHISIDASGSMSGRRFRNAIKSAVAIAQAASMTTGIRVQISLRGTSNMSGNVEKTVTVYAYDSATDKISKIKKYFPYLKCFGCTPEGLSFKSILPYIKSDAKGDECIFINYSDGAPSSVTGTAWDYNGVRFTKKVVNEMKELGINVLSYFIDGKAENGWAGRYFKDMYGKNAEFIDTSNLTQISRSMNNKFLELSESI